MWVWLVLSVPFWFWVSVSLFGVLGLCPSLRSFLHRANPVPVFQFCLRRELPVPVPGTKGGIFCIFVGSINLTWRLVSSGILQVVGVSTRLDLEKIRKKNKIRKFPISPNFP